MQSREFQPRGFVESLRYVECLYRLTGGAFPLSVTLATERIFEAFLSPDRLRAFFHGHTYTDLHLVADIDPADAELFKDATSG